MAGLGAVLILKKNKTPEDFEKQQPSAPVQPKSMLKLLSPDFENNGLIPKKYTCDGQNINPALEISNVLEAAKSLVLIIDDPDAPGGTWNHWIVFNIDPAVKEINEESVPSGGVLGTNDFGKPEYGGPCPPSGVHRYFFRIYALDTVLNIPPGAERNALEKAMENHILDQGELVGQYSRQ